MLTFFAAAAFAFMMVFLACTPGCGGGGAVPGAALPAPVQVSFYGDSILSGGIKLMQPDGSTTPGWLNPLPVQRITALSAGRITGVDWSLPGATVQDARDGTPGMPFGPFAQAIKADSSRVVVIGYATANALRFPRALAEYEATLADMVLEARDAGKRVLLLGAPYIALPMPGQSADDSAAIAMRINIFDLATKAVAARTGVRYIDLRQVVFFGVTDMADDVHPNQAYSARLCALIAPELGFAVEALPAADFHQAQK